MNFIVVIGRTYDTMIDLWSMACTVFEIYSGKILFAGKTNNEMLKLMFDVKGRMPNKVVKKAMFREKHFDESFNFMFVETDKITQKVFLNVFLFQSWNFLTDAKYFSGISLKRTSWVQKYCPFH